MNAYYTHQKYLTEYLDKIDFSKNVYCLEFGTGDGSSSIFEKYTNNKTLTINAFEHDLNWLNNMKQKYSKPNYIFNHVEWSNFDYDSLKNKTYDLVFVDQGEWNSRIETIDNLIDFSKVIILHDYCYYNGFRAGMKPVENMTENYVGVGSFFHNKYDDKCEIIGECEYYPPTLILKNRKFK